MSINFQIVTPDRLVYQDQVDSVTIPTTEGEITVLTNHIPLVTILTPGELVVRNGKDEKYMAVSGGFVTVHPPTFRKNGRHISEAGAGKSSSLQDKSVESKGEGVSSQTKLVILADTAERAEELTIEAIEQARERAKALLEEKRGKDEVAFADAAAGLERELARLKVARKHLARGSRTIAPGTEYL